MGLLERDEPYELYVGIDVGYLKTKNFACGKCHRVYPTYELAETCCKPVTCSICGKVIEREQHRNKDHTCLYYVDGDLEKPMCSECYSRKLDEKVPIVEYKGGPVYDGDFYESMEDYLDCMDGEELPEFVMECEEKPVPKIDINRIEEDLVEQLSFEDSYDALCQYKDLDELREFINNWNKKQTRTYWECTGNKVRVPKDV